MTKSKKHKCTKGKVHHYLIEEYADAQARWVKNGSPGAEVEPTRKLRGTCTFCGYNRYFPAAGADASTVASVNSTRQRHKIGSFSHTPNRYAEE